MKTAKDVVQAWVEAFNAADPERLAALYHEDAVNHQVVQDPVVGRAAIRAMFEREFAQAEMVCVVEHIIQGADEHTDWAVLEWRDPLGLRGCGFFQVRAEKIAFQRGYWDRLSFQELQGLSPTE